MLQMLMDVKRINHSQLAVFDSCVDCKNFGLVSIVALDATCGQNDGELCTTVSGGTAPFVYTVTNRLTGAVVGTTSSNNVEYCITGLGTGIYWCSCNRCN